MSHGRVSCIRACCTPCKPPSAPLMIPRGAHRCSSAEIYNLSIVSYSYRTSYIVHMCCVCCATYKTTTNIYKHKIQYIPGYQDSMPGWMNPTFTKFALATNEGRLNPKKLHTLPKRSWGTWLKTMGSMVVTLPKRTSGMYNAHTTWAQPEKHQKMKMS